MEPFIGQIMMVGFNFAPRGWAFCDGQLLSINQYTSLFSLLGTIYGGDGRTTFGVPDLRGRVPMHQGQGPGLTPRQIGQMWGRELEFLTPAQLPAHSHSAQSNLSATIPAVNTNADSINPTADTVLGIGNKPAGLSTEQVKNFSTSAPEINMKGGIVTGEITIENTGGSQAHGNMQPFTTVNFIIALDGLYPSRS